VGGSERKCRCGGCGTDLYPPHPAPDLNFKPTNVNHLVHDLEELVRRAVGPAIHLDAVGLAWLRSPMIDPGQSVATPLNLCIDARNAMWDDHSGHGREGGFNRSSHRLGGGRL
jgi:hypothetical protein